MRSLVYILLVAWNARVQAQLTACQVPALCTKTVNGIPTRVTVWKDFDCESTNAVPSDDSVVSTEPDVPPPVIIVGDQALQQKIKYIAEPGWTNGPNNYQYRIVGINSFVPYSTAKLLCENLNATVAYVGFQNSDSREYIVDNILKTCTNIHGYWIDLSDKNEEGVFVWGDGSKANSTNTDWGAGQPDGNNVNPDCVAIARYFDYKFDDVPCESANMATLCERYIGF